MTGLYNRRFDEQFESAAARQESFCLAMIDLDGF